MQDRNQDRYKVNSLQLDEAVSPVHGHVRWDPARSLWNGGMLLGALVLGPIYFSWTAFFIFWALLLATMCCGHSVGFHRRLIHRTFECHPAVERFLVWMGVLVGMQGPFWVIRAHDFRDWAQRQPDCHSYLRHGDGLLKDGWWNLHCRLDLDHPPGFDPGPGIADDKFYSFLQRTWMLHQLPLAALLFWAGDLTWLVWGTVVRVAVGVHMHWLVGYYCHVKGSQDWLVDEGAIQAHNVAWAAFPSMGESWHNNHHAFPASARHGLYEGQSDIGFAFVKMLEKMGLAWNVQTPDNLPPRPGITPITPQARHTLVAQQAYARSLNPMGDVRHTGANRAAGAEWASES